MIPSRLSLPRFNVRTKILAVFLILSVVSLIITGYIALITISGVTHSAESSSSLQGQKAMDDATAALLQSEENYLVQVASDQAEITNVLLEDTETELGLLVIQAKTLQANPPEVPLIRSYGPDTPPENPSQATLSYILPKSSITADSEEFRKTAGMDDLLKGVYDEDTNVTSVYLVTDSGIFRAYPWSDAIPQNFDPRERAWFTGAKETSGVYWSKPYVDSFGHGLVVTSSEAVPTPYGTWVIACDARVDVINAAFLNRTLQGRGYAVLLDSHGDIISRPNMSSGNYTWEQSFPRDNVLNGTDPALAAIGRNMTSGRTGVERAWFGTEESFIAYAPVRSLNWSVALSLPVKEVTMPIVRTRAEITASGREAENQIAEQSREVTILFSLLFGIILVIVIALSITLSKAITRPVDRLKQAALALGHGDLDHRVELQTGDEFEELADSFNTMAADLRQNIRDLQRTTAEKERYASEMEIAKEIQETFLPEKAPDLPGYEIVAVTIPAMEIGGDLYDFIPLHQGRWGFVIGDVSGKGVSAALYMALCQTQIHASGESHSDPSEAIRHANRLIYGEGRSSMFITAFYAVLDPEMRLLTYVNAGHNPPLLVRGDPLSAQMIEGKGVALGVLEDVEMQTKILQLEPGDLLLLYTDGITEAFDENGDYYGEERMMDVMTRNHSRPVQELRDILLADIRRFAGKAPQSDDITFILIRVREEYPAQ